MGFNRSGLGRYEISAIIVKNDMQLRIYTIKLFTPSPRLRLQPWGFAFFWALVLISYLWRC